MNRLESVIAELEIEWTYPVNIPRLAKLIIALEDRIDALEGTLRSGSKTGPKVKAIAASERDKEKQGRKP